MKGLAVVILAAGQGTRMKSGLAKVLHPLLGMPLVGHPLAVARSLKPERIVIVVGVQGDQVEAALAGQEVRFALQKEQKGTGHAVRSALPALRGFSGDVLVLYGDSPLYRPETAKTLVALHRANKADLTLLTAITDHGHGYGRILRDKDGKLLSIVEEKDCNSEQFKIREINPGLYCYDIGFLRNALPKIKNNNRQNEYYLTDLVELAVRGKKRVASVLVDDEREIHGVNSMWELARAGAILRERINRGHCDAGVAIVDPATTWIGPEVSIAREVTVEPGSMILGPTEIGRGAHIEINCRIDDSKIGPGVRIKAGSVIEESEIGENTQVGPMAHLRPGSKIGKDCRIGNYVETKKATLGDGAKASHLTYIGDAELGRNINIGCGFITCNYDGEKKWKTIIEDDVFVGSDTQAVAPVTIGKGAYIGSGSTITKDVPPGALAFTRAPLTVKEGWARKKKSAKKSAAKKSVKKKSAKKPARKKAAKRKK